MAIYLNINVYINVLSPVLGQVRFAEPVFIQELTGTPRLGVVQIPPITTTNTNIVNCKRNTKIKTIEKPRESLMK